MSVFGKRYNASVTTLLGGFRKTLPTYASTFHGDRNGTIHDPFGHVWTIATHVEDVPPDEMSKRAEAAMAG